jgi:hypothetical protein
MRDLSVEAVPATLREKAAIIEPFNEGGAKAYRDAADIIEAALRSTPDKPLTIAEAAKEYGWNHEALRRRVSGDADLDVGVSGRPLVTHATMAKLGRGRGPRSKASSTRSSNNTDSSKNVPPGDSNAESQTSGAPLPSSAPATPMNAHFQKILDRATRRRAA